MSTTTVNWAVAAPGKIAAKFAQALSELAKKDSSIRCYAVASRTAEHANEFAKQWGFAKAYGSYEALFADSAVDVVYIANPHPFHAALSLQAISAGKHVVVEKPATVNATSLQQVVDAAHDNNRFYLEAFWSAYNKTILEALDWVRAGKIGAVTHVDTRFCMRKPYDAESRLFNPDLAGGALLDVGIYPLTFSMMVAKAVDDMLKGKSRRSAIDMGSVVEPRRVVSNARIIKGVDRWNGASLTFANGLTATMQSAVDMEPADNAKDAYIYGEKGYIHLPLFWMAETAELFLYDELGVVAKTPVQKIAHPFEVNGYENEIIDATKCILAGRIESPFHTSQDALSVCKVMDMLRSQWHLVYPFEAQEAAKAAAATAQNVSSETKNETSSDTITIYTDGGCSGNPGPGGWGCVIIDGAKEMPLSGGEPSTTNNKMELTAAISALYAVCRNAEWKKRKILVYSDSQYVKNGITSWIKSWKLNGWKTSSKKPVMNKELWEELDELYSSLNVEWAWVKGHAGVKYNEMCDQLCQQEIRSQIQ